MLFNKSFVVLIILEGMNITYKSSIYLIVKNKLCLSNHFIKLINYKES